MAQFQSNRPKSKCLVCGKEITVRSVRGGDSNGFCSRVCSAMKRYSKRYVGPRSERLVNPINLERKRYV